LSWCYRYNISLGTAAGLGYLHEGCRRRIIHRDIKTANILLTEDFEAQLAGQLAIKDATGFHSATFDEKEKKATFVYLNFDDRGKLAKGQKIVDVYVD